MFLKILPPPPLAEILKPPLSIVLYYMICMVSRDKIGNMIYFFQSPLGRDKENIVIADVLRSDGLREGVNKKSYLWTCSDPVQPTV